MGTVLSIAAAIGLVVVAFLAVAFNVALWGKPGTALVDWMADAGGERKAHYRPLRAAAFVAFVIGLCFLIYFVPRGHVPRSAIHGEHVAGVIALGLFGVATVLFLLWWWLAGLRTRGD